MEMTQNDNVDKAQSRQYVTFILGNETYGVSIMKLNEIITCQQLTSLPNAPSFLKGVINLRGEVIPVIDMRERFHMEPRDHDMFTVIIVMEVCGMTMSMIVDSVNDVVTLSPGEIKPRPYISSSIDTSFIHGMGIKDGRFIILLDIDKIFNPGELQSLESMETC